MSRPMIAIPARFSASDAALRYEAEVSARKLIEAVYDMARGLDCSRVYWHTHETNTVAMRLYDGIADRPGFVQYRKVL